jgi:hypothetical protein
LVGLVTVGGRVAVRVALAATAKALPSYSTAWEDYWAGKKVKSSARLRAAEMA